MITGQKFYLYSKVYVKLSNIKLGGEKMQAKFDLQHFCCGPKGCEIEIVYGEMMDAEN